MGVTKDSGSLCWWDGFRVATVVGSVQAHGLFAFVLRNWPVHGGPGYLSPDPKCNYL